MSDLCEVLAVIKQSLLDYIQAHSICSSRTKLVIHFLLSGSIKNGGRDFTLLPWPPLGVDGE